MLAFYEAILFLIIYGVPLVLLILLIVKVLFPFVKWINNKLLRKWNPKNYWEWYDSLTPEEKIAEELKGMNGTRGYSMWKHSKK